MSNKTITLLRLEKQQKSLKKQPIPGTIVQRVGVLNFHFCIYGLQQPYKGGLYHGVLELHQQYPFQPPTLKFFTPSGRFEINKPICTTFTNFHKQSWSSAWNVRTMIMATISFMNSNQLGYASINQSTYSKRTYAKKSFEYNMKNEQFKELFGKKLQLMQSKGQITRIKQVDNPNQVRNQKAVQGDNKLYVFFLALLVILLIWVIVLRNTNENYITNETM